MAIANSRLISFNEQGVTFKWKDYRAKHQREHKTMVLAAEEFIRRFFLHVLPTGFHRIRHYGLLANAKRKDNVLKVRELLQDKRPEDALGDLDHEALNSSKEGQSDKLLEATYICPECGAGMVVIENFVREQLPRAPPHLVSGS